MVSVAVADVLLRSCLLIIYGISVVLPVVYLYDDSKHSEWWIVRGGMTAILLCRGCLFIANIRMLVDIIIASIYVEYIKAGIVT